MDVPQLYFTDYNTEIYNATQIGDAEGLKTHVPHKESVQWLDIRGIHDEQLIKEIGHLYGIHELVLEDITDVYQRPKFDEYEEGCFVKIEALGYSLEKAKVVKESVSIFLGDGFVISFQENTFDLFTKLRDRLIANKGRIRKQEADYLFYVLSDYLIDHYFAVLEVLQDNLESLEVNIADNPSPNIKRDILKLRKDYLSLRKSIIPLKEALLQVSRSDHPFLSENTKLFIRDVRDHVIQISENVESGRDLLSSLQDLYLSEISFKMNKVIQLLTIVTTMFVPLTFLAGIYGMNFEYIPELHVENGYYILIIFMIIIVIIQAYFFKRKGWFDI